jgi:hypothetical protein
MKYTMQQRFPITSSKDIIKNAMITHTGESCVKVGGEEIYKRYYSKRLSDKHPK